MQTSQTVGTSANKADNEEMGEEPAKWAGADTPGKHKLIYSLYLAGKLNMDIAKEADVAVETVRTVILKSNQLLKEKTGDFLLDIVRTCFIKTVDGHQMIANEHTIQFIATQIARDKLKAGSKDRLVHDHRLRLIGREITNTNKAFVDLLVRMGVPHPPDTDDKGSHRDSSPVIDFYDTIDLGDAQVQTVKTMERQLSYVRKLSKKADKGEEVSNG